MPRKFPNWGLEKFGRIGKKPPNPRIGEPCLGLGIIKEVECQMF